MKNRRKFVQGLVIFVHLETAWVVITSLTWMYELRLAGPTAIDPTTAAVALGTPGLLILGLFKVCQLYLKEYSNSGVLLEGAQPQRTELKLNATLTEKDVSGNNTQWVD